MRVVTAHVSGPVWAISTLLIAAEKNSGASPFPAI
jgi:hypothetical protein